MTISTPIISTVENVYEQIKHGSNLSTSKFSYSHPKKTNGRVQNLTLGRIWFNLLLPDNYPLINEPINKSKMNEIIIDLYKTYNVKEASIYIQKLQSEAFKLATISPNTFNIDLFIPPKEWLKKKEEFESIANELPPLEFKKKAEILTKELLTYFEEVGFRANDIMESGAKGSPISDWGALLVSKGYVMDVEGNLLGPIVKGLNDGYSRKDYYNAGSEARKNFYIRSALTAYPGYLTRKIANANAGLIIDPKIKDCETKKTFEIVVTKDLADILLQRNYISQTGTIKNITNSEQIIGKKIKLRTPLYCKAKDGICETCYGNLFKTLNTSNIGLLAAGAINIVGINTMMKMRHAASSVNIKEVDFVKMLEQASIDIKTISNILDIQKTKITAKESCSISININDYNDTTLIDCGDKFQIVGILSVQSGQAPDIKFITLPFGIMVDCFKTSNVDINGYITTINYEPGDVIIQQEYYDDQFNERTVDRLFEASAKYINTPEILTMIIKDKIKGIDLVHIETIVSNMFRDENDTTIPARLTTYKNAILVGQKKLPYIISWLSSIDFENINKAIKIALINGKDAKLDPIEKLVLEKYSSEN